MFAEQTLLVQEQANRSSRFCLDSSTTFVYPALVMVLLSLVALVINHFYYQYPGNVYLPPNYFVVGVNLLLAYAGFFLLQGRDGKITQLVKELVLFFLVMMIVCLVTNAAQYTPFPTIDQRILLLESFFHIDTNAFIKWAHEKPELINVLEVIYRSLDYQLCYIPLMVILLGRKDLIREYYFFLLTSVLVGFMFYYFFPTTAPASVMSGDYFCEEQKATYLKFFQIHHGIQPSTQEGGLIAFPSFHVIWAWFCLWSLRKWPVVYLMLLPINLVLIGSCVLLGWHYCMDIVGSLFVIIFVHYIYRHIYFRYHLK